MLVPQHHNETHVRAGEEDFDKMNPHKVSPVDMMMNLMEKYSKHLESIVIEKTQDLLQEKQKTDRLLYSTD